MNKKSKRLRPHFIILVLALIAFFGIGYWAYKSGQLRLAPQYTKPPLTPTPTPTPKTFRTGKLKTYVNNKYKYSIDYHSSDRPPILLDDKTLGYKTSGYERVNTPWGCIKIASAFVDSQKTSEVEFVKADTVPWNMLEQLLKLDIGESLLVYQETWTETFTVKMYYKRLTDVTLSGATWIRWQIYDNWENLNGLFESIYAKRDNKEYWIVYERGAMDTDCNIAYVDQILSTFQFLE